MIGGFSPPSGFSALNRGGSRGVPSFGGLSAKPPADGGGGWQDYKPPAESLGGPVNTGDGMGPRDAWNLGAKKTMPVTPGAGGPGPAPAPVQAAPPTPSTPLDVWNNWLKEMGPYLAQTPTSTPVGLPASFPGASSPSSAYGAPFEGRRPRRFGPSDEFEEGVSAGFRTL